MGKVIMPKKLTAENGAKALLMNEFHVLLPEECDECLGSGESLRDPDEDCEVCGGAGEFMRKINVPWTVIKEIYSKAVEHLSQPIKNIATHNCNENMVGGSPDYWCGICGQRLRR